MTTKAKQTEAKHTPGPWTYEWDSLGINILDAERGDGSLLARVLENEDSTGRDTSDVAEGNARLIAAAPELLMFVRQVEDAIKGAGLDNDRALSDARALIAKVERGAA